MTFYCARFKITFSYQLISFESKNHFLFVNLSHKCWTIHSWKCTPASFKCANFRRRGETKHSCHLRRGNERKRLISKSLRILPCKTVGAFQSETDVVEINLYVFPLCVLPLSLSLLSHVWHTDQASVTAGNKIRSAVRLSGSHAYPTYERKTEVQQCPR